MDFPVGRGCAYAAKDDLFHPESITGPENRANIIEASNIVEDNHDRVLAGRFESFQVEPAELLIG